MNFFLHYFVSNEKEMTDNTERLIIRLELQDELTDSILTRIVEAINTLPRWKFATKVHHLYVNAVVEISGNDPAWVLKVKTACNERAFNPPYPELVKKDCGCHISCVDSILNTNKYYCKESKTQ